MTVTRARRFAALAAAATVLLTGCASQPDAAPEAALTDVAVESSPSSTSEPTQSTEPEAPTPTPSPTIPALYADICDTISGGLPIETSLWIQRRLESEAAGSDLVGPAGSTQEAILTTCPEYGPDLQHALDATAPDDGGQAPTVEEMYPVALDNCVAEMIETRIYTLESSARTSCEAAMDPARESTHWMIDTYYTAG